jgi:hypothetical protein
MTPPTVTQPRPTARLTGTATGGDGGSTGAVDVETAVDRPVVVSAVVDTTVVVVEPSERPTEACDSRVISIEPSTPSMPASATTPIRTSMAAHYRESRPDRLPMNCVLRFARAAIANRQPEEPPAGRAGLARCFARRHRRCPRRA